MRLKLLFLIASFAFMQNISAQYITITGKVIDESNKEPIEYANVSLFHTDSTFVKGVNSDSNGFFSINETKPDNYLLLVSYLGYTTSYKIINKHSEDIFLNNINLEPSTVMLNEAVVTAQSVIDKPDRKLITPSESQIKASSNGMDLLQKLQLSRLKIDPINNKISVSGNGEVQLRINGVQVTNAEVMALRPEDVIRVEYYDDPGVRYGSASAVIDYIIRRTESGGNINGNGMHGISMIGFADDFISAKYNHKKSEFSTNIYWRNRVIDWTRSNDEYFRFPDQELHRQEKGLPTKFKENAVNTAINYSLMEKDNYFLNATLRYNYYDNPDAYTNRRSILETSYNPIPLSIDDQSSEKSSTPALDIYFQQNLKNDQLLIFNIVGTYNHSSNKRLYQEHRNEASVTEIYSDISGDKYSLILEGIYERKLGSGKLTSGAKLKQTYANNTYQGNTTADISMRQSENYLYTEYQIKKGKFSYMANVTGTRFYYSQGDSSQEKYMIQPSVRINYNPNENTYIRYRFNYWGHIPSLSELNNIEQSIDSLQIRRGNPNLKPNYSLNNNLSVGYNKGIIGIDLLLEYTYRNKPIMESIFLEDGKFIRTSENQRAHHHLQIQSTFKFKPWKDYITLSLTPGVNRYISQGNNYTHTYTNKFIQVNVDAIYKSWIMNFSAGTSWDWFYGETKNEGEKLYVISFGYNKPNYSFVLGTFNPFGADYKRNDENWSAQNYNKSKIFTENIKQMVFVKASFNINLGRQFKSENKRLNNRDNDSGIMSGTK